MYTDSLRRYIIVAQRKSLRVYSTSDSLLIRVIDLEVGGNYSPTARIVAFEISSTDPNILWVGYSMDNGGIIYRIDWTTGKGFDEFWSTSSKSMVYMTAASMRSADRARDIVFTTEERQEGGWRIQAHELTAPNAVVPTTAKTIYTSTQEIQLMKTSDDGAVVLASSGSRILVGHLRKLDVDTVSKLAYTFRVFESSDPIFSIDLRVSQRAIASERKQSKALRVPVVDVAVGDVRGAIFIHDDLLSNLMLAESGPIEGQPVVNLMPRKLHWHRKTVQSVKWSRDSNYLISGGSETVMVLWQLDTGKHQFLPNMTAAIRNIVVSPVGSSYAVRLGDNSTMVLSTAELVPTANISGLQARVIKTSEGIDSVVERVQQDRAQRPLMERTPAIVNPAFPSQLLLAVGDTQEGDPNYALRSSQPYLQTFDIASSHNVSRQALTRTNVTGRLEAPNAHRIDEARITHIQSSHDGKWLATIDQWMPPRRDVEFLCHGGGDRKDEQRRRREVYLKFWKLNENDRNWELVTRIDAPHAMAAENYGAGEVLSIIANPKSLSFATIGEDGYVKIWRPRTRKRDEVVVKGGSGEALVDWRCQYSVPLGASDLTQEDEESVFSGAVRPEHASLAYSADGSVLAAALSGTNDRLIHLIQPHTGTIRSTLSGLHTGSVISLAFLSHYLIILADSLLLYNLVTSAIPFHIALGNFRPLMSLEQKAHMMHLAADPISNTFAVALPTSSLSPSWLQKKAHDVRFLEAAKTEVAIFNTETGTPLITHTLEAFATALLPAVGSAGYIILDAAAEITPIAPKTVQTITSTAQPIADINLDSIPITEEDMAEKRLVDIIEEQADDEEMADVATEQIEEDDISDDDDGPRVVSQQALANLFNIGPAFAMPPLEEMFYQVAGLFSSVRTEQSV